MMIFLELFYTFLKIGLFSFGGGYGMLSVIQGEVVTRHAWLTAAEFTDIVAVSQMTPGPIGINSATYVGYAVSGNIFGSLTATIAVCLPSFLIILTICKIYARFKESNIFASLMKTLRPIVIGLSLIHI